MRSLALAIAVLCGASSEGGSLHSPHPVRIGGFRPPRAIRSGKLPAPTRLVAPLGLEAYINAEGIVHDVRVVRPSGDPKWDREVVAAYRKGRYLPATLLGKPTEVVATIVVRVEFR
jgi:TonB family protein